MARVQDIRALRLANAERLRIPSHVLGDRDKVVVSQPSRFAARIVTVLLAALFASIALLAIWVMVPPDTARQVAHAGIAMLACLALFSVGLLGGWLMRDHWQRIDTPFLHITPTGIESHRIGKLPSRAAWASVQGDPRAAWDVHVDFTGSRSVMQEIRFQLRDGTQAAIPLSLPNTLDCLRFKNNFALRRAVLLHLASQPSPALVFDSSVFLRAQVNPRTWAYMPWPGRLMPAMGIATVGATVAATACIDLRNHHIALVIGCLVLGLIMMAAFMAALHHWLLPGFRRSFVFETGGEPLATRR